MSSKIAILEPAPKPEPLPQLESPPAPGIRVQEWAAGPLATAYAARSRLALWVGLFSFVGWYLLELGAREVFNHGETGIAGVATLIPLGLFLLSLGELQRSFRALRLFAGGFVTLG